MMRGQKPLAGAQVFLQHAVARVAGDGFEIAAGGIKRQ